MMTGQWSDLYRVVLAGLTSALVAIVLTPLVRSLSVRKGWVSKPQEDRWSKRVVARFGGVAMFLGFLTSVCIWMPLQQPVLGLLVGLGLVFLLGLLDDIHRIPPYTKLLGQLVISCIVVASGIRIELIAWTWVSIPLSVLWLVFVMNAFNLLDNMDGLSAGTGVLASGFCALFAVKTGHWPIAMVGAILCGSCLSFLRFNFPPAKIYMGDSGSHFLGLSLGALALLGSWYHSTQLLSVLIIPVSVLAVPIFDTCFVTIQRLLNHKHPFSGGADHVSHRLAILGLSNRQTLLVLYGICASLGMISIVASELHLVQSLVIWGSILSFLVLFGLYLAKVKVYQLQSASDDFSHVGAENKSFTFIQTMFMHKRRVLEVLVDFSLIVIAYVLAHLLRYEGVLDGDIQLLIVKSLPVILLVKMVCFSSFGLYRGIWRYFGFWDVITVFKAIALGSFLSTLALLFIWRFEGYSRAILIIDGMLTFLFVGGSRVLERLLDEWIGQAAKRGKPVLVFGAGDTGASVVHSLKYAGGSNQHVVGFVDDDLRKQGSRIHDCLVLGSRSKLPEILEEHRVSEVLIAISDPPGELLQFVRQCCESKDIAWRVVQVGVTKAL